MYGLFQILKGCHVLEHISSIFFLNKKLLLMHTCCIMAPPSLLYWLQCSAEQLKSNSSTIFPPFTTGWLVLLEGNWF